MVINASICPNINVKIIVKKNNRIKHMLNKNTYLLNNARSWLATAAAATAAAAADACCIDTLRPFSDSITCSIKEFFPHLLIAASP